MDLLEFLTIYAPQYQNFIAQIRDNLVSQQMFKDPVFAARLQQFIGLSIDSHYDVIKTLQERGVVLNEAMLSSEYVSKEKYQLQLGNLTSLLSIQGGSLILIIKQILECLKAIDFVSVMDSSKEPLNMKFYVWSAKSREEGPHSHICQLEIFWLNLKFMQKTSQIHIATNEKYVGLIELIYVAGTFQLENLGDELGFTEEQMQICISSTCNTCAQPSSETKNKRNNSRSSGRGRSKSHKKQHNNDKQMKIRFP